MSNTTIFDNLNPMSLLPDGIRETITAAVPNTLRHFGQSLFRARWTGGKTPETEIKAIEENPHIEITWKTNLTREKDGADGLEILFKVRTMSPQ